MTDKSQAIVAIIRKGGCKSIKRLCKQAKYLDQGEEVVIEMSERHGGAQMSRDQYETWASQWAAQTGHVLNGESLYDGEQDLTTHIVVSFPPGTDHDDAYASGRDWAEDVFGSGRNGGEWDYVTAFHTNRAHPHMHVVVNRRSLAARGQWLAISHRNRFINYDTMREALVTAAARHNINLDASSRRQRGVEGRGPTSIEYRRRARVEFQNHFADRIDIVRPPHDEDEVFPELTGRRPPGNAGGSGGGGGGGGGGGPGGGNGPGGGGGGGHGKTNPGDPKGNGAEPHEPPPVPLDRRRAAEDARDWARYKERRQRERDEIKAGPSRPRRVPASYAGDPPPGSFPADNSDLYAPPSPVARDDDDALAARQLHREAAEAETARQRREKENKQVDPKAVDSQGRAKRHDPKHRPESGDVSASLPPEKQSLGAALKALKAKLRAVKRSSTSSDQPQGTGHTSEADIQDQIRREIEEYRSRRTAQRRDNRERDEIDKGPDRRRVRQEGVQTVLPLHEETRGEQVRRKMDERAAAKQRQAVLKAQTEAERDAQEPAISEAFKEHAITKTAPTEVKVTSPVDRQQELERRNHSRDKPGTRQTR